MKPKAENPNEEGMLEYLEDIIGSSRLKPLIDMLNIQVEQLNEYRTERNNRVKLAEEDRNKLQEGFDEAKKWVDTKNELTRLSNQLYQAEKYFNVSTLSSSIPTSPNLSVVISAQKNFETIKVCSNIA